MTSYWNEGRNSDLAIALHDSLSAYVNSVLSHINLSAQLVKIVMSSMEEFKKSDRAGKDACQIIHAHEKIV
jgi:hypothetical protein